MELLGDPKIKASPAARFFGIAEWQSSVPGPVDKDSEIIPYMGPHVLQIDENRALLRAGGDSIAARWAISCGFFFPIYAVVLIIEASEVLQFFARGGRTCHQHFMTSGGVVREDFS